MACLEKHHYTIILDMYHSPYIYTMYIAKSCICTINGLISMAAQILFLGVTKAVVIVWQLDLQLPMQSAPLTTKVVSLNPTNGEVYSMQLYVIKFVSDLRQGGGFLIKSVSDLRQGGGFLIKSVSDLRQVGGFLKVPPPIKLIAMI